MNSFATENKSIGMSTGNSMHSQMIASWTGEIKDHGYGNVVRSEIVQGSADVVQGGSSTIISSSPSAGGVVQGENSSSTIISSSSSAGGVVQGEKSSSTDKPMFVTMSANGKPQTSSSTTNNQGENLSF